MTLWMSAGQDSADQVELSQIEMSETENIAELPKLQCITWTQDTITFALHE